MSYFLIPVYHKKSILTKKDNQVYSNDLIIYISNLFYFWSFNLLTLIFTKTRVAIGFGFELWADLSLVSNGKSLHYLSKLGPADGMDLRKFPLDCI